MKEVKIISPVLHDGKSYAEGDTLSLSAAEARALVEAGVAFDHDPAADKKDAAAAKALDDATEAAEAAEAARVEAEAANEQRRVERSTPVTTAAKAMDPVLHAGAKRK